MDDERKRELVYELMDAAVQDHGRADELLAAHPWLLDAPHALHDETPVHFLAIESYTDGVRYLLSKGADPNIPNEFGATPLLEIASWDEPEVIALLLEHGADPNASSTTQDTVVHSLVFGEGSPEILERLVQAGARLDYQTECGQTVFDALPDNEALATKFLEVLGRHGGLERIDAPNEFEMPPLVSAVQMGQAGTVRALLRAGADPNVDSLFPVGEMLELCEQPQRGEIEQALRHAGWIG